MLWFRGGVWVLTAVVGALGVNGAPAAERLPLHGGVVIEVMTLHDYGSDEAAVVALPAQAPKSAVLLLPDALGSRDVVERRCALLGQIGFLAVALDVYDGQSTETLEEARRMDARLRPGQVEGALSAALKMVLESPRYQCPHVSIAVWGPHAAAAAAAVAPRRDKVAGVALLEPSAEVEARPLGGLGVPLAVFAREDWPAAGLGAGVSVRRYSAPAGFLLAAGETAEAVDAWSRLIDTWGRAALGRAVETSVPVAVPEQPAVRRPLAPRSR